MPYRLIKDRATPTRAERAAMAGDADPGCSRQSHSAFGVSLANGSRPAEGASEMATGAPRADLGSSRHPRDPVEAAIALDTVQSFTGPAVVDLDETLYLRNSTEDFIDSAVPATLALVLMRLLDLVKPWRLFGGDATGDVWRVRCILILFPWTMLRWRSRVAALAAAHGNHRLITHLRGARGAELFIVTNGFRPVVRPLVSAMGLEDVPVIAARVWNANDRRDGKRQMARAELGDDRIRAALVLTDSPNDADLLEACAVPLRTVWPEARYVPAFSQVYLPGDYISKVKRPGQRFILRAVLQEDFAYWVLCSVGLAAAPIPFVAGLLLLLVSFWAIYERGYVDNDLVAETLENDRVLSASYHQHPVPTPRWQPWIWSFAFGAAGVYLVRFPGEFAPLSALKWAAGLVLLYAVYKLYNRLDKPTRIWMFPVLQVARAAAFVLVVSLVPVGACALAANALSHWVSYYLYRSGGSNWPAAQPHMTRLLFLTMFTVLLWVAQGNAFVVSWSLAAIFLYSLYRARRELSEFIRKASLLNRASIRSNT